MLHLLLTIMSFIQYINDQGFMECRLSDSYENQILFEVTGRRFGKTVDEYRRFFQAQNLQLEYIEVRREMAEFDNPEALNAWIYREVENDAMTELVFSSLKTIHCSDGKLRFPTKKLIVKVCAK